MKEADIFAIAVDLPASERSAYIREACGDDETLCKSVEQLIQEHEDSSGILDASLRQISEKSVSSMDGREEPDGSRILYFGDYELHGEIARGAMGVVYRAEQKSLKRTVAIKMIRSTILTNEADITRFRSEAESAASLDHPHIVPIYEIGEYEDQHYFSMKLIEGGTLRDHLEVLREDPNRTAKLIATVARAIHSAHQRGILHRDLKPSNILIDKNGEPHVTDFGLAKQMESASSATLSGQIMGTPSYMPPEQADGGTKGLTTAADVYSLGAIIYELLTGQPPHKGDSLIETLKLVSTTEPVAPRTIDSKIDRNLETIALKCLSKDPSARYSSAKNLANELERWLRGEPISARPVTGAEKLFMWIKRRPGPAAAAILGVLLLLTLGIGGPLAALQQVELRKSADEATSLSLKREQETRSALAQASLSLADAALREGDGIAMQNTLETVPSKLRNSTWHYLFEQSDTSLGPLDPPSRNIAKSVVGDPSRPGVFAASDAGRKIIMVDVRTGKRLLEFTPKHSQDRSSKTNRIIYHMAFSPDGKRLALGAIERKKRSEQIPGVVLYDPRSGEKIDEWDTGHTEQGNLGGNLGGMALEFNSDGTKLLVLWNGQIEIRDGTDGALLWQDLSKGFQKWSGFTPNGRYVVRAAEKNLFKVFNASNGKFVREFSGNINFWYVTAMGSSGLIAQVNSEGEITILDSGSGKLITSFQHPIGKWTFRQLAFTPDGEQLVTLRESPDGSLAIKTWNAHNGTPTRSLLGGKGKEPYFGVHPYSGELLVWGDYARAWDLTGPPPNWIAKDTKRGNLVFWGNDDTLFSPFLSNSTKALSLKTSEASILWAPKPKNGEQFKWVSVSADGQWAAVPDSANSVVILHQKEGRVEEWGRTKGPMNQWSDSRTRLSPLGHQLVVFWETLRISSLHWYSRETGEVAGKIERRDITEIHALEWLSETRLLGLVTAGGLRTDDNSVECIVLWNMVTGKIQRMVQNPTAMTTLAPAPDGNSFAEAGVDKKVRIRDAKSLEIHKEFRAHDGPIVQLAWHPIKPILATTSTDLAYRIWDLENLRMLEELRGPLGVARSLTFSPSGQRLGATDSTDTSRIWEPKSLREEATQK